MNCLIKNILLIALVVCLTNCKKFVEVDPPITRLSATSVYSSNSTAAAAINGIYSTLIGNSIGASSRGIAAYFGLSADEFKLYPTSDVLLNQCYTNQLLSSTYIPIWDNLYNVVYQTNSAIEGITASNGVTPDMKQQLIGEAKFIRAFCFFYLTNTYGDIPIITTTDYTVNGLIGRSSQIEVYQQIIQDIKAAQASLSNNYLTPTGAVTTSRVRPNNATATALLARVYLYQQKWDSAEVQATAIINNLNFQLATNLNTVFLATNNKEAIWQLEMPNNGFNAPDGNFLAGYFSTSGPSTTNPFILTDFLLNDFESGDLRKTNWTISKTFGTTTYYFPYKYKLYNSTGQPPVEYPVLFRLAEQYLIRAEARAQQGNLAGSIADLNVIRNRAGLPNTTATIQAGLLAAIYKERRVELFTEYGHRWLDLKRTGQANILMSSIAPLKGASWQTTDQLYPIYFQQIQLNPNLTQNPGYQ